MIDSTIAARTRVTPRRVRGAAVACLIVSALAAGCSREPKAADDPRARGQELIRGMSDRLARAKVFTVKTRDTRIRGAQSQPIQTERTFFLARPDRIAFTSIGDQLDVRGWYTDGKVTLVSPNAKVWARVRGEATIDDTLDRLAERFEMQMPMADFFYSVPYDALMADGMKGGYVGRETVEQVECEHVTFADDTVEWHLWLPRSGEPVPKKYRVTAKRMRGQPTSEVVFLQWDLRTRVPDANFAPQVPEGFERIAMAARTVDPEPAPAAAAAPGQAPGPAAPAPTRAKTADGGKKP
jgi:hypothetical protein